MLRATPPNPAISTTGQICWIMSANLAHDQGAITYWGEKKEVVCCRPKVNTRTYIITSASQKTRGWSSDEGEYRQDIVSEAILARCSINAEAQADYRRMR